MPKLSGNKGEWSEIYVLFRLLEIGKLFAADADLNKMDGIFYNIINITRSENIGNLSFEINSTENTISIIKRLSILKLQVFPLMKLKNF